MNDDNICIIVAVTIIILLLIGSGCGCYCMSCSNKDSFADVVKPTDNTLTNTLINNTPYNSLYTSPESGYIYTQPPGDVRAQEFAGTGQGTSGEFFPIQGRAAGVFMKNSGKNNSGLPSVDPGVIGGNFNYTGQMYNSSWIGFNNFGAPFSEDNSYLISGANQRVANSGQQSIYPAQQWLPHVQKDSVGFVTQDSDSMVPYGTSSIESSPGGKRFLQSKMVPNWKKIIGSF